MKKNQQQSQKKNEPEQITIPQPQTITFKGTNNKINSKKQPKQIISSNTKQQIQNQSIQKQAQKLQPPKYQNYNLPDQTIADFISASQCPPPLIMDTKVYYQERPVTAPPVQVQVPNIKKGKLIGQVSISVQTDDYLYANFIQIEQEKAQKYVIGQQTNEEGIHNHQKNSYSEEQAYAEDFESIEQSMQLKSSQVKKLNSPQTSIIKRPTKQLTQSEYDDQISEIYSQEFDSLSQSHSMKRTHSLEKISGRFLKKSMNQDDISECYAQDFESISQSYNNYKILLKK